MPDVADDGDAAAAAEVDPARPAAAAATTARTHPAVLPHPAARAAACHDARSAALNRTTNAASRTSATTHSLPR
ncbi:hypothetical protein [Kineococcus arenarius]|uniref:hypothetical protein n=1 Tax=unclassified Kineococcus TaxID=2621656 RepID=UPI003D7D0FB7